MEVEIGALTFFEKEKSISSDPMVAVANQYQSTNTLKVLAKSYLEQQIGNVQQGEVTVTVGRIDPRLHLKPCNSQDLQAYLPPGSEAMTTTTIGVRCANDTPWSFYVPVKVKHLVEVVVSQHPIQRGTPIQGSDLTLAKYDVNRLPQGYFLHPGNIIGKVAKRPLRANIPLRPQDLQLQRLIRRGEGVTVIAKASGIKVTSQGVAQNNGVKGERILIKSSTSRRIIEGIVTGPSEVEVVL